jgi:DNA-binding LytR/AlgR family response regulator
MIHVVAIDDEEPALDIIEAFCSQVDFIRLDKTFTTPKEALRYLNKFPVDLLFLDINMPSLSGVELYRKIRQSTPVIFTTAHLEYAVEGFNLSAVDYLLKPFSRERFVTAVTKARDYIQYQQAKASAPQSYFFLRADYSLLKINFADILYIESLDDYVRIFLEQQKPVVARMTMKNLLEKLPARDFARIHRSFIVPFARIDAVRQKSVHIGDKEFPVGESYLDEFLSHFKD